MRPVPFARDWHHDTPSHNEEKGMFNLTKPCVTCPFRKGQGERFQLKSLNEIITASAFQCHKTVDYSGNKPRPGNKPQQCAGLMSVLHREGCPNQIMQVGERLGGFDPGRLDHTETYTTLDEVFQAHGCPNELPSYYARPQHPQSIQEISAEFSATIRGKR
jgi:hypothetical protein